MFSERKRLCDILSFVKENFTLESNAEITVEVNPDSGKKLDFALMKNTGFNRLSIGMQSAVPAELKKARQNTHRRRRKTYGRACTSCGNYQHFA